jgi:hypothetical protein
LYGICTVSDRAHKADWAQEGQVGETIAKAWQQENNNIHTGWLRTSA